MKLLRFFMCATLSFLLCIQLVPNVAVTASEEAKTEEKAGKAKAGDVKITNESDLTPYFPDDIFRKVVFEAVRDGKDGAVGIDVVDALYNFRGTVKYNLHSTSPDNLKIKSAHGIEYLRNAYMISLKYNHIEDFSWLNKPSKADEEYYGQILVKDTGSAEDDKNVVWDIAGNPIEKLPVHFGGRLKILQPGGSSYTYPLAPENTHTYLRSDTPIELNETGTIDIHRTDIIGDKGKVRDAEVVDCYTKLETLAPGDHGPLLIHITSNTNTTANYLYSGTVDKSETIMYM